MLENAADCENPEVEMEPGKLSHDWILEISPSPPYQINEKVGADGAEKSRFG